MKKHFLSIMSVLIFLSACSDKYKSLYESAPKPALSFNKDTITIREKDYRNINWTNNGRLTINCADQSHQLNLQFSDTSSKVHFNFRGDSLISGQPILVMDKVEMFVSCDTVGIYGLDFKLTDQLGKITQKQLIVKCLANQKAKASFFYVPLENSQLQSWGYVFDASNSQKPDGIITAYHYSINGQAVTTNLPVMNWTFHAKGTHNVNLYVTDDLGKNSDMFYKQITIE
jgi:uncharacterized lipoprotein YajG